MILVVHAKPPTPLLSALLDWSILASHSPMAKDNGHQKTQGFRSNGQVHKVDECPQQVQQILLWNHTRRDGPQIKTVGERLHVC